MGKNIYTISQISTLHDIPGIQIEMSDKFRRKLFNKNNNKMNKIFINCIKKFHLCMSKL